MTMRRADWLVTTLQNAGLKVVAHAGWQGRGDNFADLRAVVLHHDASPPGDSPGVPAYMLREMAAGRAGAQLWVNRQGVWHVLAAGVAYHAGRVLDGMPGNTTSLGVELDHTTGESWPQAQLDAMRLGVAAILVRLGRDAGSLHMHKTICSPAGRKSDPAGLDLTAERARTRRQLSTVITQPAHITKENDMTPAQEAKLDKVLALLTALVAPRRADKVDSDPGQLSLADLFTQDERHGTTP